MVKSLKVTLYYANWCHFCGDIKRTWHKVEKGAQDIGKKYGIPVTAQRLEDSDVQKQKNEGKINGKPIEGYPTIKFSLTSGKDSKEYEYLKEREPDVILDYIDKVAKGLKDSPKS